MIRPFLKQQLFALPDDLKDILIAGREALTQLLVCLLPIRTPC
jgi:hypothetical protein